MDYKELEKQFKAAKGYEFNSTDADVVEWITDNFALTPKKSGADVSSDKFSNKEIIDNMIKGLEEQKRRSRTE